MRIAPLALLMILTLPAAARAQDRAAELASCKALTDHVAELIRAGEAATASRSQSRLRYCLRIQRAELRRQAQQIVDKGVPPKP